MIKNGTKNFTKVVFIQGAKKPQEGFETKVWLIKSGRSERPHVKMNDQFFVKTLLIDQFHRAVHFSCRCTWHNNRYKTHKCPDSDEFKEKALEIVSEYKNVGFLMLDDLPGPGILEWVAP